VRYHTYASVVRFGSWETFVEAWNIVVNQQRYSVAALLFRKYPGRIPDWQIPAHLLFRVLLVRVLPHKRGSLLREQIIKLGAELISVPRVQRHARRAACHVEGGFAAPILGPVAAVTFDRYLAFAFTIL
jgi:hypothetical protein